MFKIQTLNCLSLRNSTQNYIVHNKEMSLYNTCWIAFTSSRLMGILAYLCSNSHEIPMGIGTQIIYPYSDGVCVCCLAFKYYSRTARPTGSDTVASSSNHFWQWSGSWDYCHHTWHSTARRQTRQMYIAMHNSSHSLYRLLLENSVEPAIHT